MNKAQIIVMWIGIAILVLYSNMAVQGYGLSKKVGQVIEVLSIQWIIVSLTIGIILQIGYLNRKINK